MEKLNKITNARTSLKTRTAFRKHAKDKGMTASELLRRLIEKELKKAGKV